MLRIIVKGRLCQAFGQDGIGQEDRWRKDGLRTIHLSHPSAPLHHLLLYCCAGAQRTKPGAGTGRISAICGAWEITVAHASITQLPSTSIFYQIRGKRRTARGGVYRIYCLEDSVKRKPSFYKFIKPFLHLGLPPVFEIKYIFSIIYFSNQLIISMCTMRNMFFSLFSTLYSKLSPVKHSNSLHLLAHPGGEERENEIFIMLGKYL